MNFEINSFLVGFVFYGVSLLTIFSHLFIGLGLGAKIDCVSGSALAWRVRKVWKIDFYFGGILPSFNLVYAAGRLGNDGHLLPSLFTLPYWKRVLILIPGFMLKLIIVVGILASPNCAFFLQDLLQFWLFVFGFGGAVWLKDGNLLSDVSFSIASAMVLALFLDLLPLGGSMTQHLLWGAMKGRKWLVGVLQILDPWLPWILVVFTVLRLIRYWSLQFPGKIWGMVLSGYFGTLLIYLFFLIVVHLFGEKVPKEEKKTEIEEQDANNPSS